MARLQVSSVAPSDTATSIQFLVNAGESSGVRVLAVSMKAREQNSSHMYIGTSSSLPAATSFELPTGAREDWAFSDVTIGSSAFWVRANTSSDQMDFVAVMDI